MDKRHDIEMLAYFIWEKNGRLPGRALDHWLEAEYLILTGSFVEGENRVEQPPKQKPAPPKVTHLRSVVYQE